MKPLLFLTAIFFWLHTSAQDSTASTQDTADYDKEFLEVQVPAKFPGGDQGWNNFLSANIRTQTPARHKAPAGSYTVVIRFTIDKEGNVKDAAVLEDPGYGTAEDVLRVLHKSPRWTPAMQDGRNVIYVQKQKITYEVTQN
ncbi:MAG TPA: energy transducer TonB [Parafilimonas sp.]|nr:energy transducer TonB [Parafilimonas sp.]